MTRGGGVVRVTGGGTIAKVGVVIHSMVRTTDSPGPREVDRISIRVCVSSQADT